MPNFAEGDNAFMGLFGDVPNKGTETSKVKEPPKQDEPHVSEEQPPKRTMENPTTSQLKKLLLPRLLFADEDARKRDCRKSRRWFYN